MPHVKDVIKRLHDDPTMSVEEIRPLLHDPYVVLRANAVLGLGKRAGQNPEICQDMSLIEELVALAKEPRNIETELVGRTISMLILAFLLKSGNPQGVALGTAMKQSLPRFEQDGIDELVASWTEFTK